MSSSNTKKTPSPVKIIIVIGVAAVAAFAALWVFLLLDSSTTSARYTMKTPTQINDEEVLLKRAKELPEVKSFLSVYPNATVAQYGGSGFQFTYQKPYPNNGFIQVIELDVLLDDLPHTLGTGYQRQGIMQPYRGYYYTVIAQCHPSPLDSASAKPGFPNSTILEASDNLCPKQLDAVDNKPRATITVNVGDKPQQAPIQDGRGNTLMTTYLPVEITQRINVTGPTQNMTLYPVFANWEGVVRDNPKSEIIDENNNSIATQLISTADLHITNVTCQYPYLAVVTTDPNHKVASINETHTLSLSTLPWGDTLGARLSRATTGLINFTEHYGIVPAHNTTDVTDTSSNTAAGNKELSGLYHLSFTSFYPAIVKLPKHAEVKSSVDLKCPIVDDIELVQSSGSAHMFVYDYWFGVESN